MKPVNLLKRANFTKDGPMMEMVHDSEQAREVLFSVGKGQEIRPHSSTSVVTLLALSGRGKFLAGEIEHPVETGDIVVCKPNELHGAKAEENLLVLAVIAPRP